MNDTNPTQLTDKNENILAALAHATALIPTVGVIAPIVIWTTQKDKSEHVAFQALQAIVYQFIMIIAWIAGMLAYVLSIPVMMLLAGVSRKGFPVPIMIFPMFIMLIIFCGGGVFVLYGLFAAVRTFMGKDFRYILIGNWLKKYMTEQKPA
jgi:uncharacterized Tic20 family protein